VIAVIQQRNRFRLRPRSIGRKLRIQKSTTLDEVAMTQVLDPGRALAAGKGCLLLTLFSDRSLLTAPRGLALRLASIGILSACSLSIRYSI